MTSPRSPEEMAAFVAGFDTGYASAVEFIGNELEIASSAAQENTATIERLRAQIASLLRTAE